VHTLCVYYKSRIKDLLWRKLTVAAFDTVACQFSVSRLWGRQFAAAQCSPGCQRISPACAACYPPRQISYTIVKFRNCCEFFAVISLNDCSKFKSTQIADTLPNMQLNTCCAAPELKSLTILSQNAFDYNFQRMHMLKYCWLSFVDGLESFDNFIKRRSFGRLLDPALFHHSHNGRVNAGRLMLAKCRSIVRSASVFDFVQYHCVTHSTHQPQLSK